PPCEYACGFLRPYSYQKLYQASSADGCALRRVRGEAVLSFPLLEESSGYVTRRSGHPTPAPSRLSYAAWQGFLQASSDYRSYLKLTHPEALQPGENKCENDVHALRRTSRLDQPHGDQACRNCVGLSLNQRT